ncbi:hypothetical protein [Pseudomonas fulva]|uniref:hypothetical protein n=1 Tax=Pseudomonas fulva TaxID=47880 RepID=UPI000D85B4A5|nr:hypothetical protein [Pseudomonas fulva]PYB83636.1 hypothetical protein DMX01_21925 [Pseudomonas fulva]PYC09071.1 hypothetical protein DMX00_21830 [Pseudomonas fulva]
MTYTTREALIALLSTSDDFKAADAISEALPYAKGAMLFRFFQEIQEAVEGIEGKRSPVAPPNGFAGLEATRENCNKWFMPKRQKVKNVWDVFQHWTRRPAVPGGSGKRSAAFWGCSSEGWYSEQDQTPSRVPVPTTADPHHRNWRAFQWFSCLYQDYVAQEMDCLSDPSHFLDEIKQTLKQLQALAHELAVPCH